MTPQRFDVTIGIAGGLLWLAPRSLGGLAPEDFCGAWIGGGPETVESLIARSAMMPLALYQDDGYTVRFVVGALTEAEKEEWTAHAAMNIDVPCGELLVSGVLTPDFPRLELPAMVAVDADGATDLGCYLSIPPGLYRVDVYSYPPGDLSGSWGHIVDAETFGVHPGLEREDVAVYFERTRGGEEAPAWVRGEDDGTVFVNFLIHVSSADPALPAPALSEDGVGIAWEMRKPTRCPRGISSTLG